MIEGTAHQALYRRWRAQTFSEIVGQEAVVQTLRNAVVTGRVAHAILFTGPRGTGVLLFHPTLPTGGPFKHANGTSSADLLISLQYS